MRMSHRYTVWVKLQEPCDEGMLCHHAVQAAGIVCLGYALLAMAHEEGTPSLRIATQSASRLSEDAEH